MAAYEHMTPAFRTLVRAAAMRAMKFHGMNTVEVGFDPKTTHYYWECDRDTSRAQFEARVRYKVTVTPHVGDEDEELPPVTYEVGLLVEANLLLVRLNASPVTMIAGEVSFAATVDDHTQVYASETNSIQHQHVGTVGADGVQIVGDGKPAAIASIIEWCAFVVNEMLGDPA